MRGCSMGGKTQGNAGGMPGMRGPSVRGPVKAPGPSLVNRVREPVERAAAMNRDAFKDTAAPIVSVIAGIVSDYFVPGTGVFAAKAADRTVREQVNVINGRPFFEGVKNVPDLQSLAMIGGSVAGGVGATAGGMAGSAAGNAVAGAAGRAAGQAAGSLIGGQAAGYLVNYGINAIGPQRPQAGRATRPPYLYGGVRR